MWVRQMLCLVATWRNCIQMWIINSSTCRASTAALQSQLFLSLLGQHVQPTRAHGRSLSDSAHMFSPLIKVDKPYCVRSVCLTFRHSHARPHWEALCYSLRHPGASHVCGHNEFILLFVFLLGFLDLGESRVGGKASTSANLASP